jgi:hypothetical protein
MVNRKRSPAGRLSSRRGVLSRFVNASGSAIAWMVFHNHGFPVLRRRVNLPPGQLHRNQPIVRRLVVFGPNLCLTVLQTPPFEMTLQDAQGQTVTSAEFCRPQSALFEFTHSRLISSRLRRFRFGISWFAVIPAAHQKRPPMDRWGC